MTTVITPSIPRLVRTVAPAVATLALASTSALGAVATPVAASPGDLIAVDSEGRPIADAQFELVTTVPGAFDAAETGTKLTTNKEGRAELPKDGLAPLDFVCTSGDWAIRAVHGDRQLDEEAGVDLLDKPIYSYAQDADVICVLERTGELEVLIPAAEVDDVTHIVFIDERPEPGVHRAVRSSGEMTGKRGTVRVPAGRGIVYAAADGHLGAPIISRNGPLLVSINPGDRATVSLEFSEGRETIVQAPFGSIPFDVLEALAPDAETVIARFPFEESPLRLPSLLPFSTASADVENAGGGMRLPKHLVRAAGIPLVRPAPGPPAPDARPEDTVAPPPLELLFTLDIGGKLRLPEAENGWIQLAKNAVIQMRSLLRAEPPAAARFVRAGTMRYELERENPWTGSVRIVTPDGEPAPFREVLVTKAGGGLARGITGPDGTLRIEALGPWALTVALADDIGRRTVLDRENKEGSIAIGALGHTLAGTWLVAKDGAPVTGGILALVSRVEGEAQSRRFFGTRSTPIAAIDALGRYSFGRIPSGEYEIRAMFDRRSASSSISVNGETAKTPFDWIGVGDSFQAAPR